MQNLHRRTRAGPRSNQLLTDRRRCDLWLPCSRPEPSINGVSTPSKILFMTRPVLPPGKIAGMTVAGGSSPQLQPRQAKRAASRPPHHDFPVGTAQGNNVFVDAWTSKSGIRHYLKSSLFPFSFLLPSDKIIFRST